jgi:hypothetical protein
LPHAQVVKTLEELREIEPKGADIEQAVQFFEGDLSDVAYYIHQESKRVGTKKDESNKTPNDSKNDSWPFEILGIADDGKAYFITGNDRMLCVSPTSITRNFMLNLIGVSWWREIYGKDKEAWEDATSDLIHVSSLIDFDPDRMRGRGAWREPDGRVCYHDGKNTVGEFSEERIYLRRSRKDIGISAKPATADQRKKINNIASELTFETFADCIRTLGWSVLAPFAGALPWRPAGLLTAASGTGKTTIVNQVIKPLSEPIICSGGESTAAGIRQRIGVDSCAIVVEEAETDTQKKRQNRDETFSLMRQSTSDDSPDVLKGTVDGKGLSFTLRSMFFFVAISPEIDCEADENRIFRIGLAKANYARSEWLSKETELRSCLTPEICERVRAYTWQNLSAIITLAERVATQAQLTAGIDNRTAFAESLLLAAYLAVFDNKVNPDNEYIASFVKQVYSESPIEKRRNENEEMLDTILDSLVRDGSDMYRISDLLAIIDGSLPADTDGSLSAMAPSRARRIAGNHGVGLDPDYNIAIRKNHTEIMRMLGKGKGYHLQLTRHPRCIDKGKGVGMGGSGNTHDCVVIRREDAWEG